jgi:predicted SnoaL-like aldol condensation-catalyzing enzyme
VNLRAPRLSSPYPTEERAMSNSLKDAATDFVRLAASGKVREAYNRHVGPDFRHHNPYFRGDAESLAAGMEENARKMPNKVCEIQRALEDGDLVAVHSHVRMQPQDRGIAVVHLFRFERGRIAELWDIGQPVPEESQNANGMF